MKLLVQISKSITNWIFTWTVTNVNTKSQEMGCFYQKSLRQTSRVRLWGLPKKTTSKQQCNVIRNPKSLRLFNAKNIKFFYLNIGSIQNKFDEMVRYWRPWTSCMAVYLVEDLPEYLEYISHHFSKILFLRSLSSFRDFAF